MLRELTMEDMQEPPNIFRHVTQNTQWARSDDPLSLYTTIRLATDQLVDNVLIDTGSTLSNNDSGFSKGIGIADQHMPSNYHTVWAWINSGHNRYSTPRL